MTNTAPPTKTATGGGVFGAVKSASNTFQGDDGKGVYGNSNVAPANNYNE